MYFQDGTPFPYSSRRVLQEAVAGLDARNLDSLIGVELEWHLTKLVDPRLSPSSLGGPGAPGEPPEVESVTAGYQYQSEINGDLLEPILSVLQDQLLARRAAAADDRGRVGPLADGVHAAPAPGARGGRRGAAVPQRGPADLPPPRLPRDVHVPPRPAGLLLLGLAPAPVARGPRTGGNAFAATDGSTLTPLGLGYVAGLLEHAREASVFVTPTVNGYKRFQPYSLAPDRAGWGEENRGSMIRVAGGAGDPSTHLENRAGEPAANSYLYIASQILAGLDGIDRGLDPGSPTDNPYETEAASLPGSLGEAVDLLDGSSFYRETMGDDFVDYIVGLKRSEVGRFQTAVDGLSDDALAGVTDWEHREYFGTF